MRLGPRTEGLVLKVPLYIEDKHLLRQSTPKLRPSTYKLRLGPKHEIKTNNCRSMTAL